MLPDAGRRGFRLFARRSRIPEVFVRIVDSARAPTSRNPRGFRDFAESIEKGKCARDFGEKRKEKKTPRELVKYLE